jgi:aspartyl-tRNA(Asn)/glutamyl-tRNA(Gln) amidotransferase subunit A
MTATIARLAKSHLEGTASPVEALEACIASIERLDSTLGAWQVLYLDEARLAAQGAEHALSSGHRIGPFHGVPFALKDIVDLEGRITTGGSAAMRHRVSPTTATIARRLLAAGGVLVGKTKTVELALGGWGTNAHMGTPRNPWDSQQHRAPGGSSSGSGVAVSSRMVPAAIGTDTGGSVRLPASLCGIVGLKVTEGRLPTDGIVPLSHTLDTPGPLVTTVEDAALLYDVLLGRAQPLVDDDWRRGAGLHAELRRGVAGLRLGVLDDAERSQVEPDVLASYDRAIDQLADLGAELVVFCTPLPYEEMKEATFVLVTSEAYTHHGHLIGDPESLLDPAVRARALPGRQHSAVDYVQACLRRRDEQRAFLAAMDSTERGSLDAVLTPTTPMVAPVVDGIDESATPAHFTRAGNYLGLCALSLPSGLTEAGLPVGLQIMARPEAEALCLRVGSALEEARGPMPLPPLH